MGMSLEDFSAASHRPQGTSSDKLHELHKTAKVWCGIAILALASQTSQIRLRKQKMWTTFTGITPRLQPARSHPGPCQGGAHVAGLGRPPLPTVSRSTVLSRSHSPCHGANTSVCPHHTTGQLSFTSTRGRAAAAWPQLPAPGMMQAAGTSTPARWPEPCSPSFGSSLSCSKRWLHSKCPGLHGEQTHLLAPEEMPSQPGLLNCSLRFSPGYLYSPTMTLGLSVGSKLPRQNQPVKSCRQT